MRRHVAFVTFALLICPAAVIAAAPPTTAPAGGVVIGEVSPQGVVKLLVNKSQTVRTIHQIRQTTVGSPAIADINVIAVNQMIVTGKKAGSTTLTILTDDGIVQMLDVEVAGGAMTRDGAAKTGVSRVENGDVPGFIKLMMNESAVHVNVNHIAAVVVTPSDGASEPVTRVVVAVESNEALPAVLIIPNQVTPPHEVMAAINFARQRRE